MWNYGYYFCKPCLADITIIYKAFKYQRRALGVNVCVCLGKGVTLRKKKVGSKDMKVEIFFR